MNKRSTTILAALLISLSFSVNSFANENYTEPSDLGNEIINNNPNLNPDINNANIKLISIMIQV